MILNIDAACGSFIGNGRGTNEDNFYFHKKHLPANNKGLKNPLKYAGNTAEGMLFAVFDGMGGEVNGEEASGMACQVFSEEFKKMEEIVFSGKEFFLRTCQKANDEVNRISQEKKSGTMGTTVAALYLTQDEVVACNLGDSKIFRVRQNQMIQISEDHTDEKIMLSMGVEKKPVLLQFIGIPNTEMMLEPYICKGELQAEDTYVICSDGVTDVLGMEEIYDIVSKNVASDSVNYLLAEVNKRDGLDNSTVIVIKVSE